MLLRIQTGWNVAMVDQANILYLVSTVQTVTNTGLGLVFTDGHSLAAFTNWFDDVAHLNQIDWRMVRATQWNDTAVKPDRQRRKQAEFLVHRSMPWSLILRIGVLTAAVRRRAEAILDGHPAVHRPVVEVQHSWYY